VSRQYVALVWGVIKDDERLVENNVGRSSRDRRLMTVVQRGGKYAATEIKVEERYDCASLITCKLRTGRTHQIRVHLSHVRHPLVGDHDYGGRESALNGIHHLYRHTAKRALHAIHRQALHARSLGFMHPMRKTFMEFASPLPHDLLEAIQILRPPQAPFHPLIDGEN
jgi:23S rRNA pseudouridine1911/1915/1917 synthase